MTAVARDEADEEKEEGGDGDFLMKWESLLILRGDGDMGLLVFIVVSLFAW